LLFSYFFFIDDFEIYRNNYCSLKTFYFILVALIYKKQRKIANIFTFTLKSYEVKIENIVEFIFKFIRNLNREIDLTINKKIIFVCAFEIILLDNMLQ